MLVKIHESYRKIVAICDSDIVGKTFTEGIREIQVRPNFFKGEEKNKQEVLKILQELDKEDATFNIVGEKSVQIALEAKVIEEHGIIKIQGIPIALGLF
ncbi:DUF424 family protein [Candidatus Woesearchaeota archaeon]|jgi:uncharacterized protein|nr:DUF424 family protein [Candidatus Woesearchaeota archaeon]